MKVGIADAYLEKHPELRALDLTSRATLDRNVRFAAWLAAYFRFSMTGWEHLPAGPCLVVATHSIGSPVVLPLLARAWHLALPERPARGLMHRVAWQWPFRQIGILQRLGGIYAHPEVAAQALAAGKTLLVFPGGEFDAMRPFYARYRVRFGGRTGFVRLARAAGVPIVPLAICGSQSTYVTLPGARTVANLIALRRWTGLKLFPLTLGELLLVGALAIPQLRPFWPAVLLAGALPLPSRIEARLLPLVEVSPTEPDAEIAERVRQRLEAEMGLMAANRTTWLG